MMASPQDYCLKWCRGTELNRRHKDFQSLIGTSAIFRLFQLLRYQIVTRATLEYVGLC